MEALGASGGGPRNSVGSVSNGRSTAPICAATSSDYRISKILKRNSARWPSLFASRRFTKRWHFTVSWPALDKAALIVLARATELNGDHYEVLSPAADALAAKHPLAATLILRAMIDFALKTKSSEAIPACGTTILRNARACRNGCRYFRNLNRMNITAARLKSEHGPKTSFWSLVSRRSENSFSKQFPASVALNNSLIRANADLRVPRLAEVSSERSSSSSSRHQTDLWFSVLRSSRSVRWVPISSNVKIRPHLVKQTEGRSRANSGWCKEASAKFSNFSPTR